MKLCPQCEFIYEDDQKFCDMDGEVLAHDTRLGVFSDTRPTVAGASPAKSRLKVIVMAVVFGLVISGLLSLAHYASSPPIDRYFASRSGKSEAPETGQRRQIAPPLANFSSQPANDPSQSATNPEAASVSVSIGADELTNKPTSQSARSQVPKPTDNSLKATDNRLTIARRLPPLPRLTPLPQLPPPRRLPVAKPEAKQPGSATARQQQNLTNLKIASPKTLIVEVKPTSGNAAKRSRVKAFLKKTGRILKKPFQH